MSKTRYAPAGAPLSQERYLSSPEYAELRGISGPAVATKAALMATPEKRSLLFFLQSMSLKPGGLKEFCRLFLATFQDRIGTTTMHRAGMKAGKVCDPETAKEIGYEIASDKYFSWETDFSSQEIAKLRSADYCLAECRGKLSKLEGFIIELCINPKLYFSAPGEAKGTEALEQMAIRERFHESEAPDPDWQSNSPTYKSSELPWFRDVVGALFEYQQRYEQAARDDFVLTEIGGKVFEVLDFALFTGKLVVLEGESRTGKTTAAEAWCNQHLGETRYISLSGITHKTGLFRTLAKALGIGSSYAKSSTEMQTRIEDLLQRSRLMIVIDEAHHLFSSSERVYSRPELIDWLDTSLYNNGVPIGLVCTPQFTLRMARAQKQTTWNADQFKGRAKRFHTLPSRPTEKDIRSIARKLLPGGCRDSIDILSGYAISSKLPLPALVDAIDSARFLVKREGRDTITFEDLRRAIFDYCAPSSEAMARSFDAQLANKRPGRKPAPAPAPPESALQDDCNAPETPIPARTARKTNLTGLTPSRRSSPAIAATADREALQAA